MEDEGTPEGTHIDPDVKDGKMKSRRFLVALKSTTVRARSTAWGLLSSKRETMNRALKSPLVSPVFGLLGVLIGLHFGPPYQIKCANNNKAEKTKVAYRELVRAHLKQFFVDYDGILEQLRNVEAGRIGVFVMSEDVHPLSPVIRESLTCLGPKEMLAVSLVIAKEGTMVQRARSLNLLMEDITSKKIGDPRARITNELQTIKEEFLAYLKRHIEMNVLMYQALVSLDADDYVYRSGRKMSHADVLAFWDKVLREEKSPYDSQQLRSYEPHGYWESEQPVRGRAGRDGPSR